MEKYVMARPPRLAGDDGSGLADEVHRLREVLRTEPLARIMTGDLELFHSNFIAWFFDAMPESADRTFHRLIRPGAGETRRVLREWRHLDLVLEWPGSEPIVIENKVKSLPDLDQLNRYAAMLVEIGEVKGTPTVGPDAGELAARLVLLTMAEPSQEWLATTVRDRAGLCVGWDVLSYRALAADLRRAVDSEADSYEKETVLRYTEVVQALAALTAYCAPATEDEVLDLPLALAEAFEGTPLLSALRKMRGFMVAGALEHALRRAGVPGPVIPEFTNGTSLITWWADTCTSEGMVPGVQVQAGQIRRCAKVPHLAGRGPAAHDSRAVYATAHPSYFDFSALGVDVTVMPKHQSGVQGFNRFDPDFVYRYVKVPDITIRELSDLIVRWAREMEAVGQP